jgi:hypothetical protein
MELQKIFHGMSIAEEEPNLFLGFKMNSRVIRGDFQMKAIVLTVLSFAVLQTQALANQASQVVLSAQEPSKLVQITDQKFEPIYSQEPYQTTCSREVVDHVETRCDTYNDSVCSGGGEVCTTTNDSVCNSSGCTSVPRRSCHTTAQTCTSVPRRSCSDHNVYRTDYYSCTQYRTVVSGQRLVKTFNHQVEVVLANPSAIGAASLQIGVLVAENSVTARLMNSFTQNILTYQVNNLSEADAGSVLNSSKKIVIDLGLSADAARKLLSSSIQNLELGRNAIRFDLPNAAELSQNLNIGIKLVRNRKIFGDTILFNNSVASSKLGLVGGGADLKVVIPFAKLGIDSVNSMRHDLSVSVSLNAGNALNLSDFSEALNKHLELSREKIYATF